jgi:phosphomannomutase
VTRTKIGEIHVSATMVRLGAAVGGENIGGVIVPAVHPCRDSYTAMALALELLAASGDTVSATRAGMPVWQVAKEKIPLSVAASATAIRRLRRRYADRNPNLLDGVFIDFGESWVHVRRSLTEPVVRITAEARTATEAGKLAARFLQEIAADPKLSLLSENGCQI